MIFFDKTKGVEFKPVGLLKLVQEKERFGALPWPFCDVKGCWNRSEKMYGDDSKKAYCLCELHTQELKRVWQEIFFEVPDAPKSE